MYFSCSGSAYAGKKGVLCKYNYQVAWCVQRSVNETCSKLGVAPAPSKVDQQPMYQED